MRLAPEVAKLNQQWAGAVKVGELDIDANMDVTMQYSVMGVPTLIRCKQGQPVERLMGFMQKDRILVEAQPPPGLIVSPATERSSQIELAGTAGIVAAAPAGFLLGWCRGVDSAPGSVKRGTEGKRCCRGNSTSSCPRLSTHTRPPCARTTPRVIASPSPGPPPLNIVLPDECSATDPTW